VISHAIEALVAFYPEPKQGVDITGMRRLLAFLREILLAELPASAQGRQIRVVGRLLGDRWTAPLDIC